MKFRDIFSVKYILFALFVLAVMIPFVIAQSNNTVKIKLGETQVLVNSAKYQLAIDYDAIESLEVASLAEPGEKLFEDSYDDNILRCGVWQNDTWGEYTVCVDLDVDNCIVAHLNDGRIFVFNRKNVDETESIYQQILDKLPSQ